MIFQVEAPRIISTYYSLRALRRRRSDKVFFGPIAGLSGTLEGLLSVFHDQEA